MSDSIENTTVDAPASPSPALTGFKWLLAFGGLVAIVVGALIFLWPGRSAIVITMILAVYALVGGLVYIALAIAGKGMSTGTRVLQGLAGLVFIAAAVIAFTNPAESTLTFAFIVIIFIGVSWIFEGIAALSTLSHAPSKGWAVFFAIVSIIAGIAVLLSPLFAGAVLWMWFGISLFVIGVVQVIRAFTVGKG